MASETNGVSNGVSGSSKYAHLADELEAIARGEATSALLADDATRKRLLEALHAALPEVEISDDSIQRINYTVIACFYPPFEVFC